MDVNDSLRLRRSTFVILMAQEVFWWAAYAGVCTLIGSLLATTVQLGVRVAVSPASVSVADYRSLVAALHGLWGDGKYGGSGVSAIYLLCLVIGGIGIAVLWLVTGLALCVGGGMQARRGVLTWTTVWFCVWIASAVMLVFCMPSVNDRMTLTAGLGLMMMGGLVAMILMEEFFKPDTAGFVTESLTGFSSQTFLRMGYGSFWSIKKAPDTFGHQRFARSVASTLRSHLKEGITLHPWLPVWVPLVCALYGRRGSGKTSVIDMIASELATDFKNNPTLPQLRRWSFLVVRYDPTRTRPSEKVSNDMFAALVSATSKCGNHVAINERVRRLWKKLDVEIAGEHTISTPVMQWRLPRRFLQPTVAEMVEALGGALCRARSVILLTIDNVHCVEPQMAGDIMKMVRFWSGVPFVSILIEAEPERFAENLGWYGNPALAAESARAIGMATIDSVVSLHFEMPAFDAEMALNHATGRLGLIDFIASTDPMVMIKDASSLLGNRGWICGTVVVQRNKGSTLIQFENGRTVRTINCEWADLYPPVPVLIEGVLCHDSSGAVVFDMQGAGHPEIHVSPVLMTLLVRHLLPSGIWRGYPGENAGCGHDQFATVMVALFRHNVFSDLIVPFLTSIRSLRRAERAIDDALNRHRHDSVHLVGLILVTVLRTFEPVLWRAFGESLLNVLHSLPDADMDEFTDAVVSSVHACIERYVAVESQERSRRLLLHVFSGRLYWDTEKVVDFMADYLMFSETSCSGRFW